MGEFEITRRVREISLVLPEVTERPSHRASAFFIGRQFVMLWPDGHHEVVRPHLSCTVPYGAQQKTMTSDPERLFRPKYLGSGVDRHMARRGLRARRGRGLSVDAYRVNAPLRLTRQLDDPLP